MSGTSAARAASVKHIPVGQAEQLGNLGGRLPRVERDLDLEALAARLLGASAAPSPLAERGPDLDPRPFQRQLLLGRHLRHLGEHRQATGDEVPEGRRAVPSPPGRSPPSSPTTVGPGLRLAGDRLHAPPLDRARLQTVSIRCAASPAAAFPLIVPASAARRRAPH